jgi:hypothetical protein
MSPEWKRFWYLLLTRTVTVLVFGLVGAGAVGLLLWLEIIK